MKARGRVGAKARSRCRVDVAARRKAFDYNLPYRTLDLRRRPRLYRVGRGEQGVLLVEPYRSEILPHWRFKTPPEAKRSARVILALFLGYRHRKDFVGMDMARKFLQMGYTRSRRYAKRASGRKYGRDGRLLPLQPDVHKARSAVHFRAAWRRVEADPQYARAKRSWKEHFG